MNHEPPFFEHVREDGTVLRGWIDPTGMVDASVWRPNIGGVLVRTDERIRFHLSEIIGFTVRAQEVVRGR